MITNIITGPTCKKCANGSNPINNACGATVFECPDDIGTDHVYLENAEICYDIGKLGEHYKLANCLTIDYTNTELPTCTECNTNFGIILETVDSATRTACLTTEDSTHPECQTYLLKQDLPNNVFA